MPVFSSFNFKPEIFSNLFVRYSNRVNERVFEKGGKIISENSEFSHFDSFDFFVFTYSNITGSSAIIRR